MKHLRAFIQFLGLSRIAMLGAVLVTTGFIADIILIVGEMFVFVTNPYMGIVAYMVLPGMIVTGLLLIPLGLWWRLRGSGLGFGAKSFQQLIDRGDIRRPHAVVRTVTLLTLVNLVAFGVFGYRGYHYMDSTEFCGEVCHEVMTPELTVYKLSPHSEIECVKCHIGPGAGWFVKSKISGARQVLAVAFDTYDRPIHTPIANLRPAREVCEVCHRPELFHGDAIRVIEHYLPDQHNTPTWTVLNVRIGGGGEHGREASGIHWHVGKDNELRYYATDDKRENVVYIEQVGENGVTEVWQRPDSDFNRNAIEEDQMRTMDCVDCHNRPTHIYLPPDKAIERAISHGDIDAKLPWIRKIAQDVMTIPYETREEAMAGIEQRTIDTYRSKHPDVWKQHEAGIRSAIEEMKKIHRTYVYPSMRIRWNTYPSLIGHADEHSRRCFRCHDGAMRNSQGKPITIDCESCHFVLARDSRDADVLKILEGKPAFYAGKHD